MSLWVYTCGTKYLFSLILMHTKDKQAVEGFNHSAN